MGPPGVLGALGLLLVIPLAVSQNPFIPLTNTCSLQQCQEPVKFKYTPGEAYRYRYKANTASTVLGVSSKSTTLTLECDVVLHVITPCEHAIKIENVVLHTVAVDQGSLTDKDIESDSFTSPLQTYQLRYGFQDGIVDSVCPESGDPTWSVNVKKGIVSALQNSMDRLDLNYDEVERDVTGDCPASYTVEGTSSDGLLITKLRDLNACVGRFAHTSHIQGVGYSIKSPVQNIPIVASSSRCSQTLLTNRLSSVQCEERHLLKPFSHEASGAVTVSAQNLTLMDVSTATVSQDVVQNRETLLYNHMPAKAASHTREKSLAEAETLVRELCEDDSEVRVDSTTKFSELIDDLRGMSHTSITSLYRLSPSICRHGQQLIEDALPVVSTAASLELTRDLILNEEVSPRVANTWLMALNFIPSVDQAMMETAGGLLQVRQPAVRTRARLAVGAVLHQYCRQHADCQTNHVALEIMAEMARPLGDSCRADTEQDEKQLLLTLRSIGNAGLSPPGVVNTLNECFLSRDNPARVKVSAIEAFRRFSCRVHRDAMRAVFRDLAEDSEVRIAAYLGLMRCPSHQEIGLVRAALEQEQVNQVGSFVWTHLSNLQETSSPYQLEVQGLLADLSLKKKFSTDVRKFSRNFEISGFNSEYHMGASLDSNLVYSSRSYVPRSLNSNLTLQLFGESVNLVEVGARVEGMERVLESMFAPGGVLHNAAPEPLFRGRRDAAQQRMEQIKADFDASDRFGSPLALFHLKVFGHEVESIDLRSSDMDSISKWLAQNGPAEWANALSNTESLDISRSVKFLEGTYIVPTGLGLPLNLTVSAVAAVNVQMSGNAQLDRLLFNQELDLAFRLRPSGAVTFDGTMMVDGMAVQLGMGMKTTVHSSSLVDASLKMEGFKLVDASVNMPKDRMDLYNFESSLQFIHQDQQKTLTSEITMEGDKHEQVSLNSCTGGDKITGWRVCSHLMYVNASTNTLAPHFPLTGPTKMGLFVDKTDKTMEGYKLQWKVTDSAYDDHLSLLFDTPRSTVNRRVELKLKRSKKQGKIGFRITYPGETLLGKGEAVWQPKKKKLAVEISRQGVEVLALTSQLVTSDSGNSRVYRPTLIVRFLQNPTANLEGFVKLTNTGAERARLIDLTLRTPFISLGLNSNATEDAELYKSHIVLRHSLQGSAERETSLLLEARSAEDGDGGRVSHWMVATDWDIADGVNMAWAARWDQKRSPLVDMNKIQTAKRPEDFNGRSTFSMGYSLDFLSTEDSSKMRVSVGLEYPAGGVDLRLAAEHENIYRGLRNKIMLRYAPGRELRSSLNLTGLPMWRSGLLEGSWRLDVPGYPQPIQLGGTVRRVPRQQPFDPQDYRFRLDGGWLNGGSAQVVGQYRLRPDPQSQLAEHTAGFNLTVNQQPLLDGHFRLALSPAKVVVEVKANYEASEYGVEVQYDVSRAEEDLERSVRLALGYAGSSYSVRGSLRLGHTFRTTLDLSLDGQRDIQVILGGYRTASVLEWVVDLKWDANRDPTQRLLMDFRLEDPAPSLRNLTVMVVYPVNTVQLSMDRTMTGSWHRLRYDNHLVLAFGAAEPLEVTVTANTRLDQPDRQVSVDVSASSPFPKWRANALKFRHTRSPRDLTSQLDVSVGGERVDLTVSGTNQLPRSLRLTGSLRSSLQRWRQVDTSLSYAAERDEISSSFALSTPTNKLTADLGLHDLSTEGLRRYRGELNATTPFQGLHQLSYFLDGQLGGGEMEVTGESRVENIGHNLILKGRGAGRTGRLEGSLVVDQIHPLQNALTAKVLVDPTEDGRAFKASAVWPDNRLALEGDMHFTSASDFGVGLQFLSPFEAVKDAGLMVKHKFVQDARQDLGWKVQSEARVAWLLDNAMALTLDADLDSLSAFDARAELSLPLPRWNRASVSLRNRPQPDVRGLSTGFEAAIAGHKLALTADGSLGVLPSDKRYGTVTLTLPAGPVQQLTVAASVQRSKPGVYETFFSPVWRLRDGTSQEIRLTSVVDLGTSGAGSLQANLRLLTPWLDMLFLELHHAPTSPGDFVTRLVGSLGRQSVHLRGQLMGLREQKGYKFLLNTTSNIQFIPAFDAMTTVVTYPNYRMTFSAWTPKEYRLTVTSDRSTAASTVIETELRTPLSGVELVRARVELEQRSEERALSAEVTLPSRERIRVSGTLAPMDLRLSVTTPFDGFRTGSLRLSMGVVAERLNPVLRISWDRYKVELIGTAIPGEDDSRPTQVTGSLLIDVPVGPRVTGNFQLSEHAGSRGLVYDLTAASTVDQNSYQMEGQIFTGAQKAGFDIRTTSSDPSAHISAAVVVTVNAVPGVVGLRVQLNTPHEPIRDVSLSVEYKTGTDGRQLGAKLRHPQLTAELGSRLALVSWRHFHVGLNGKLNMGQLDLRRSVRLFSSPSASGAGVTLGVGWELASGEALAGWGRYHVEATYELAAAGLDASLLAGRDAGRDREAPTDLRLGLDLDWSARGAMGRAVLSAHVADSAYTLDVDYAVRRPYSGALRLVRRRLGSEWEVTARGSLTPRDRRWDASLNLTLPIDGYKAVRIDAEFTQPSSAVYRVRTTAKIDPESSFYQRTSHRLAVNADLSSLPAVSGELSYLHRDLDDDLELRKFTSQLSTTYSSQEMGLNLKGNLDSENYSVAVLQWTEALNKNGRLEITTTFPAIEDFLAQYGFEADDGDGSVRTTFSSVYNQNTLVEGTYVLTRDGAGSQRHTLDLKNPLHPFDAEMTYAATESQRRLDLRVTSQREASSSLSGWAQATYSATGRQLEASLQLPERSLAVRHSVERSGGVYRRAARLTISPEAFVGYQLTVTKGTEMREEEGGSVRLQLDLPARSLAGSVLAARTPNRRNNVFSSGRTQLQFQWDAERQPERQVGGIIKVSDLSTPDNMHYNLSITADIAGKPATLETSVQHSRQQPLQLDVAFLYSADPDSHLSLSYGVVDLSRGSKRVLKSTLFVTHPVSRLSVTGKGQLEMARDLWKLSGSYTYLNIEDKTLESMVEVVFDRKLGEFKAVVSLPAMIYELKSSSGLNEYRINGAAIPTEVGSAQTLLVTLDRQRPLVRMEVLYDPEQAKRLYVAGGMVNNRTARLEAYRQAGYYRVDDVVLFLRLNHSHLLTSQARWRTELGGELATWARAAAQSARDAVLDSSSAEWEVKAGAMESSLEAIFGPELDMMVEDFTSERSGSVKGDYEDLKYALTESYEKNDFYMQTILSFIYGDDNSLINSLLSQMDAWTEELREDLGVINEAVYDRLNRLIEYVRSMVSSREGDRTVADTLKEVLFEVANAYDQWAKRVYWRVSVRVHQAYSTLKMYVRHRLMELSTSMKPLLLKLHNMIETNVVKVLIDTIKSFYGELTNSDLFKWLQQTIDELYRDGTEQDAVTNLFKYSKMLLHWLYEKFGLVDVFGEPGRWLKDFWDNPPASLAKAKDTITLVYHQLAWTVDHLGVADFFQRTMAKIYREGDQFWTQTAIEGAQRYFEGKSMMVMRPERGYISFVQILPMPWYGFYQSPVWEELPELQKIRRIRSLTKSSDWTLYDIAIAYWPGSNPMEWVPPFKGHAVLSGSSTFVTFDGRLYSFQADCTYLLAADLLDDRFAVEATFRRHGSVTKTISVTAGGHTIRLGGVDGFRITADDQPAEAPLDLGELRVTRAGDTVSVLLPGWMELHCNQGSDVCSLEISRWLFGRTGGLFGTHDNEPYTDLESPDHLRASGALFASSWALHKCRRPAHIVEPGAAAPETVSVRTAKRSDGFCWGLLGAPQSEYRACHRLVDPAPFLTACQQQGDENRCVAVRAYVEACRHRGWPLKMPNKCVQCEIDGKPVFEGRTVRVQGETPATEVVFIVEAKQCNANITARRSIGRLVNSLSIALRLEKFATTKFAVVVFGGDGVQDQPQVLTVNGQIFSRAKRTVQAFRQIKPGSGGRDVFGALRRAAMLPFSAGVSRTFILMPCSACEASAMSIDYTTLANAFAEQQITLHVIMDGDLSVSKKKGKLLGIDRNKAWTLKDAKKLVGDAALLKHVRTPKAQLKLCEPLATRQTQGAIFSSSKLTPHPRTGRLRMRQLKKWMLVFGKRVALTARPQSCQNCECAADVEGTARFECMPCSSVPLLPSDLEDDIFYSDDA